jgi:hypothetical protein
MRSMIIPDEPGPRLASEQDLGERRHRKFARLRRQPGAGLERVVQACEYRSRGRSRRVLRRQRADRDRSEAGRNRLAFMEREASVRLTTSPAPSRQ